MRHYVGYDQIVGYETIVGQAMAPNPGQPGMMRASVVPRGYYPMAAPMAPPPAPQAVQVPAGRAREQVLGLLVLQDGEHPRHQRRWMAEIGVNHTDDRSRGT